MPEIQFLPAFHNEITVRFARSKTNLPVF
jgi:hypothetical protein